MNAPLRFHPRKTDSSYADLVQDAVVDPSLYTDPAIFEAEMDKIFYKTRIWVAHESEIKNPGDFKTAQIGRQPVIVVRDKTGKINAVVIGVGGFLGVGQHDIAVGFDKLKWVDEPVRSASADKMPGSSGTTSTTTRPSTTTGAAGGGMATTTTKNDWYPDHAVMSGTKEQLKAMPAFKYSESTSTK